MTVLMEKEKDRKKIINIDLEADEDGADDCETNDSNSENSNLHSDENNANAGNKKKRKITRAVKDILTANNTKFMSNFDPELSNREKRKLTRKINAEGKKNSAVHDESGVLSGAEKDVCDCLNEDCPGCHFPCPKCRSCKCGVECRTNRKWIYEAIENEADITGTNASTVAVT